MSPRFKAMFGYADDEIENTPVAWQNLIHEDDLPKVLKSFETHVASGGKIPYENEVRYRHKDGSTLWVMSRGRVVEWTDDGQPQRMMGIHVDITDMHKTQEQEIHRKAEEISQFAFIAAHDLLQPVLTIENSAKMLLKGMRKSSDPRKEMAKEYLLSSTRRLRARIKGVLDYARLLDDKIDPEELDLNDMVEKCLADLKVQITSAEARMDVSELPSASGAPSLVAQVFQNLLSNALKYRHPDRPCRVSVAQADAPSGLIGVRIEDNGIGIDAEYREQIFQLFERLHTDDEIEGEGLGLAFSQRIISLHGGSIAVDAAKDGGSVFTFTLPEA